jgi:hypothetical protein
MKKIVLTFIIFLYFLTIPFLASSAQENVDHSKHVGVRIHESSVQGYSLAYHLLDLPNRKEHHLMIYIMNEKRESVDKGKVGYLVVGPEGRKQKVMAMVMKAAFGADVDFTAKGTYTIKTKALIGNAKLLDQFTYEVK